VAVNLKEIMIMSRRFANLGAGLLLAAAPGNGGPPRLGRKVPDLPVARAVGDATGRIRRGTNEFRNLVRNSNPDVVFKDGEEDGSDRVMTARLTRSVDRLAAKVKAEWPGVQLRLTEAWDELIEHSPNSTHYEARAADLNTSDQDPAKLGRRGRLEVESGFDWVFYENAAHVHASVKK